MRWGCKIVCGEAKREADRPSPEVNQEYELHNIHLFNIMYRSDLAQGNVLLSVEDRGVIGTVDGLVVARGELSKSEHGYNLDWSEIDSVKGLEPILSVVIDQNMPLISLSFRFKYFFDFVEKVAFTQILLDNIILVSFNTFIIMNFNPLKFSGLRTITTFD